MKRFIFAGALIALLILAAATVIDVAISRANHDLADCFGRVYEGTLPTVLQVIQDQKKLTLPNSPRVSLPKAPDALYGTAREWSDYQRAYDDYQRQFLNYEQAFDSYQTQFNSLNQRYLDIQDQVTSGLEACVI